MNCQPCRERGSKTTAARLVMDTPMCEDCFLGAGGDVNRSVPKLSYEPISQKDIPRTPERSVIWNLINDLKHSKEERPAVKVTLNGITTSRAQTMLHEYAFRADIKIQTVKHNGMLFVEKVGLTTKLQRQKLIQIGEARA